MTGSSDIMNSLQSLQIPGAFPNVAQPSIRDVVSALGNSLASTHGLTPGTSFQANLDSGMDQKLAQAQKVQELAKQGHEDAVAVDQAAYDASNGDPKLYADIVDQMHKAPVQVNASNARLVAATVLNKRGLPMPKSMEMQKLDIEKQRAADETSYQQQSLGIQKQHLGIEQQQLDQGKYSLVPGANGAYTFNSKTGEAQFQPDVNLMPGGGKGGAVVARYQILKNANPNTDDNTLMAFAMGKTMPGQTLDATSGKIVPLAGAQEATSQLASAKSEGAHEGATLGKDYETSTQARKAALEQNFTLDQMKAQAENFRQGWGADAQGQARSMLQGVAGMLGVDTPNLDTKLASYQDFNKNAINLTAQATKQLSSRAAVQEFNMMRNALPSPTMSKGGFDGIVSQMQAIQDYHIAYANAADAWKSSHNGSLQGFQKVASDNITPDVFLLKRFPDDQAHQLLAKIAAQPNGKQTIAKIMQRMQFAEQNGLVGGQ